MAQDAPRRRRARAVADAAVDGLLADAEPLAKGWMLALLEDAPLAAATSIPGPSFAEEAPEVCRAALRALGDDRELSRLGTVAGAVSTITGVSGAGAALRAVDALSEVLWTALRGALLAPPGAAEPELVAAIAERLAAVSAVMREAALTAVVSGPAPVREPAWEPHAPQPPRGPAPARGSDAVAPARGSDAVAPARGPDAVAHESRPWGEPRPWRDATPARARQTEGQAQPELQPIPVPPPAHAAGTPLWMSALADEVAAARLSGRPLSLLLAELEDADRVIASAPPESAAAAFGDFVAALRGVLRTQDLLVCEADARAWVIARDTARAAAHSLAARVAEAVGETASALSGAPLVASVGISVLGEDGSDSESLAEAAEEARFRASARGIEVSRRVPEL